MMAGVPALAAPAADETIQTGATVSDEQDLSRLSLEELAMVEVTSVSRRPQPLSSAAAAVFVITAEDIRRSGAASLPEVLRLAPNLSVQRMNAVDYAISARGFNGYETANKLLVLVDGRSIYSTLHSGVFWDARDLMREDIDRIEVISGPGGALYGSNAMNGVINIITRRAADTIGGLVSVGAGNEDQTFALRYGARAGEDVAWRVYATGFARDDTYALTGGDASDASTGLRGGGRMDWTLGEGSLTLQGDVFENQLTINEDFSGIETTARGGNVLGSWNQPLWGGDLEVQAYYDRFQRDEPGGLETSDTRDLTVQHAVQLGRHNLVVGGGHRWVESGFAAAPGSAFLDPATRTLRLTSAFIQDQVALGDALTLTLGAKFEDNSFSGEEVLPNIRLAWTQPSGALMWGAISRASRAPNRIERDLTLPGFLEGGDFHSETVTAYEAGYRIEPRERLSLSVSAFYNVYDALRTASLDPVTVFPIRLTNFGAGESWGVEAWGGYEITPDWRMSVGVATLEKDFGVTANGSDITGLASVGDDPSYQALVRSQSNLSDDVELDVSLRAVDALRDTDSYVEADVRLGWRLTETLQLAVVGQNLIGERHVETGDAVRRRAFGRSVFASLRVDF